MAPAGLYTFYRVIMTVSNEVKSSPCFLVFRFSLRRSLSFRYSFVTSRCVLYHGERMQKKKKKMKEKKQKKKKEI